MKTAFVLAGGGSLGAVEVGMLAALVEADLRPDLVVGASVGAINAAYFCGVPTREGVKDLARVWHGLRRRDVFPISPLGSILSFASLRNHLVDPQPLRHLLRKEIPYERIEDAAVPLHIVAANILSGSEVVLSEGPVVEAVMASAAIPAVFPPVLIERRHLADGGVASNTPVSAALSLGADRVIVLPTGFACELSGPPQSALGMALHGLTLLIAGQLVRDVAALASKARILVVPPLCPLDRAPADFSRATEMIQLSALRTNRWLEGGGLDSCEVPGELRSHTHAA